MRGQLKGLTRKLEEDRELHFAATDAAVDVLARLSYDPEYGARPAGRVLQREVLSPLAEILLGGDVSAGGTIHLDALTTVPEPAGDGEQAAEPEHEFVFTMEGPPEDPTQQDVPAASEVLQ